MRAGRPAVVLFTAVTVGTCVFPTERDASVHVSLTPVYILFRGNDTVVTARAWQMVGSADSQPISNVVFVWTSSDPSVATVDNVGHVVGVKSGTVVITAAAANFDKQARAATDTLRVAAPLEIDSVRPKTVRYGEILSIYGVSADSIVSASLHGAALIRVPGSDTVFPSGTARSRWWVPPPARTDSLFFLGITGSSGVLGYVHGDTTTVIERDLFEPDDTVPRLLDLDGPPPFAAYPAIVFTNPALAFEAIKRPLIGADWYRLRQANARDLTIILTAPQVAGTFFTYLTDSLAWDVAKQTFTSGSNSWSFGPRSHTCHGKAFAPSEAFGDSTIVAFKNLPAGTLDAIAGYTVAGRYGLTVIAGYQSELPPDAHEDDNSCNTADLRGVVPAPFRDTLAIENPHAVDWIRFHYTQGPALSTAQVRLHALTGTHPDSLKDLDLYVIKVPLPADAAIQVLAADTAAGSDIDLRPGLGTGDYYLAVVDFAGTATRYEVCVATITFLGAGPCAGAAFPSPPLGASPSPRRSRGSAVDAVQSVFAPATR
jgi:Big-like domain-containing protein